MRGPLNLKAGDYIVFTPSTVTPEQYETVVEEFLAASPKCWRGISTCHSLDAYGATLHLGWDCRDNEVWATHPSSPGMTRERNLEDFMVPQ